MHVFKFTFRDSNIAANININYKHRVAETLVLFRVVRRSESINGDIRKEGRLVQMH
jgi:hypothetical protein